MIRTHLVKMQPMTALSVLGTVSGTHGVNKHQHHILVQFHAKIACSSVEVFVRSMQTKKYHHFLRFVIILATLVVMLSGQVLPFSSCLIVYCPNCNPHRTTNPDTIRLSVYDDENSSDGAFLGFVGYSLSYEGFSEFSTSLEVKNSTFIPPIKPEYTEYPAWNNGNCIVTPTDGISEYVGDVNWTLPMIFNTTVNTTTTTYYSHDEYDVIPRVITAWFSAQFNRVYVVACVFVNTSLFSEGSSLGGEYRLYMLESDGSTGFWTSILLEEFGSEFYRGFQVTSVDDTHGLLNARWETYSGMCPEYLMLSYEETAINPSPIPGIQGTADCFEGYEDELVTGGCSSFKIFDRLGRTLHEVHFTEEEMESMRDIVNGSVLHVSSLNSAAFLATIVTLSVVVGLLRRRSVRRKRKVQ